MNFSTTTWSISLTCGGVELVLGQTKLVSFWYLSRYSGELNVPALEKTDHTS